ncbi:MAG: hypothetical protein ACR2G9_05545 [Gaiellaceae bacterium]
MTADEKRCLEFAREAGVPDAKARELCRDRDLQRCAAFWRPKSAAEVNFDNLAGCYGSAASTDRKD